MLSTTLVLAASLVLGQVNGEDAFKSWTDFSIGGVWTCTEDGVKSEICYKRTLNDKFVQADLNSKGIPVTFLLGIDPETKKFTWWGFDGYGGTVKWVMSRESEHVWRSEGKGLGPDGEYALKESDVCRRRHGEGRNRVVHDQRQAAEGRHYDLETR